ncbi:MAG: Cys-Gln thioester bond-forming surface protein, partial [Clostridia bacterium]|nr:Cys-Gln thioester bond-forming surface protein [Clostridia bacterium]
NKYIYSFQSRNNGEEYIWNVQRKEGGIAITDEIYYCLAHGYGDFSQFNSNVIGTPVEVGGDSASSYTGAYNLKENGVIDTIRNVYNGTNGNTLTGTKYNSILWVLDHMFINGEDSLEEFLTKIPWEDLGGITPYQNVYAGMKGTENTEDDITVSDIEIIQQLAIWHFTNPESVTTFPTIQIAVNGGTKGTYSQIYTSDIGSIKAGKRREYMLQMIYDYFVNGGEEAVRDGANPYKGDNKTTALVYINSVAQPVVRLTREKELVGEYEIVIKKEDKNGNILPEAKFTINGEEKTTNSEGKIELGKQNITESNYRETDTYEIKETEAPAGYKKYNGTITLSVTKKESTDGTCYEIDKALLDETSNRSTNVNIDYNTKTITITIKDEPITGKYSIKLVKKDENGNLLKGAIFTVGGNDYTTNVDGTAMIATDVTINQDNLALTDTYTITETKAPDGYKLINGKIKLEVTKHQVGEKFVINECTLTKPEGVTVTKEVDNAAQLITITVVDEEAPGEYSVVLIKKNTDGKLLPGAVFTVGEIECQPSNDAGLVKIITNAPINKYNVDTKDTYKIKEKTPPPGYKPIVGEIKLEVEKEKVNGIYRVKDAILTAPAGVTCNIDDNKKMITLTVEDEKITGIYNVLINKRNQKGEVLEGAVFTINGEEYTTDSTGNITLISNKELTLENIGTERFEMTEITAPTGYVLYDGTVTLEVTTGLLDNKSYGITSKSLTETKPSGKASVRLDEATNTVTVIIEEDNIDLALRKFISKVENANHNEVYTKAQLENREPKEDTKKIIQGTDTTGEYNHTKKPLQVSVGDYVTYTFRVYNEGETDAYITEVTDYLPKYLKPIENDEWYISYGGADDKYEIKAVSSSVTTIKGASNNLSELIGRTIGEGVLLPAFNKAEDKISYIDLQITCEVLEPKVEAKDKKDYKITDIAEITGMMDKNKNKIDEDIDSRKDNVKLPENEDKWQEYNDENMDKKYIPGQEDDDDFEKVTIIIPKYDLSLRKFITKVNDKTYDRVPIVDTTSLKKGIEEVSYGTATYNHSKEPITVNRGDIITYTIRVYNEGNVNAYVSEITDYLPEHLEFIEDDEINKKYGWKFDENNRIIYTSITSKNAEDKEGLYKERTNGKMLLAYDGGSKLDFIDVQIRCKVSENASASIKQTNIAEITDITDVNNKKVTDLDSIPDNVEIPEDKKLPEYNDENMDKKYIPGQEDDDDFEKVIVKGKFDLALRKFITQVNTSPVNNRYPELSMEGNNIKYTHTKTPVEVCYQDTVIYTIRVYNEGEIDGYANEITDDVPEGLEFIVDNEINKEYRWKMLDENQKETEDVTKAKYIVTDYLSEKQNSEERNNLIKAYNKAEGLTETNPDHRDVKIAFKVTYKVTDPKEESRVLVNVAQISEDSDNDKDSEPRRDEVYKEEKHEDDIDYEQVKVKYFDLSLLKWVSRVIVTENGKTTSTDTGHTGEENPEPVVKVEIKSKNVKSVVVKFGYKIKIKNEGEIAGYAKEITDYIPEGLKFVEEDNKDWYVRADGKVATKKLENVLLQPGETAEVEIILTWINGEKNLGTKINIAEISEDYNPSNTPDIDSTPDNEKAGEDDIDDAPVMLVIKTGIEINPQYIVLSGVVLIILTTGIV